jgi:hypothetical protein
MTETPTLFAATPASVTRSGDGPDLLSEGAADRAGWGGGEALRQGADPPASQKSGDCCWALSCEDTRMEKRNDSRLLVTQQI